MGCNDLQLTMHEVYEVSRLLKYSVQIESITAYGKSFSIVLFNI